MKVLLVVDMIHEFVDGNFGSEAAMKIIPNILKLIGNMPAIFLCDSHEYGDPELNVWGPHAMQNTRESTLIEELQSDTATIVKKKTYDGFFNTNLQEILHEKNVKEVYICGVATDICVQHTAFGAFARGYTVNIVEDACAGTSADGHRRAIEYMKKIYGAKIVRSDEL